MSLSLHRRARVAGGREHSLDEATARHFEKTLTEGSVAIVR